MVGAIYLHVLRTLHGILNFTPGEEVILYQGTSKCTKGLKYVQTLKYRAASKIAKCDVFYIIIKILYDISFRKIKQIMYYLSKTIFVSYKILQRHKVYPRASPGRTNLMHRWQTFSN